MYTSVKLLAFADAEFDKVFNASVPQLSTEALLDSVCATEDDKFDFSAPVEALLDTRADASVSHLSMEEFLDSLLAATAEEFDFLPPL